MPRLPRELVFAHDVNQLIIEANIEKRLRPKIN